MVWENFIRMSAEKARDFADDFFRLHDVEMALRSITSAKEFDPQTPQVEGFLTAYTIHKLAAAGKNHYEILGVHDANADRVAILLHPDKNKSVATEGAFRMVHSAWVVLSDPDKRAAYDRRINPKAPRPSPAAAGTKRAAGTRCEHQSSRRRAPLSSHGISSESEGGISVSISRSKDKATIHVRRWGSSGCRVQTISTTARAISGSWVGIPLPI